MTDLVRNEGESRKDATVKLLVTGCPRSGTKYAATLLQELGLDVRHEQLGRDGISSWCLAVDAGAVPWGPPRRDLTFRTTIHQVRNPIDVIPSLSTLRTQSWQFAGLHTSCSLDEPLLLRSAKLWTQWNLHAQALASWRYRVEDLPSVLDGLCQRLSVECDHGALHRCGPNVNSRAYDGIAQACRAACELFGADAPRFLRAHFVNRKAYERAGAFSWDKLRDLDRDACEQVLALAADYGYSRSELMLA